MDIKRTDEKLIKDIEEWNNQLKCISNADRAEREKYLEQRCEELENKITNLQERCEYLERSNNRREDEIMSLRDECVDGETYKSRNEKAIEKINCLIEVEKKETNYDRFYSDNDYEIKELNDIKSTLQGSDKE